MEITRVERSYIVRAGDVWGLGGLDGKHYTFEDLPQHIKEPLSVLLTTPVGYYDERIGRRISDDVFWVYHS